MKRIVYLMLCASLTWGMVTSEVARAQEPSDAQAEVEEAIRSREAAAVEAYEAGRLTAEELARQLNADNESRATEMSRYRELAAELTRARHMAREMDLRRELAAETARARKMAAEMAQTGEMAMPASGLDRKEQSDALVALRAAKSDEEREKARTEVRRLLGKEFDRMIKGEEASLANLETRLAKLREQVAKRREAKSKLIDLRLETLENEINGLGWPGGQTGGNWGFGNRYFGSNEVPMVPPVPAVAPTAPLDEVPMVPLAPTAPLLETTPER